MMITNEMDIDTQQLLSNKNCFFDGKMQEFCHFNCKRLSSNVAKAITSGNEGMQITRFSQYREILDQFQQNIQGPHENWQEVFPCKMDNGYDYSKF